MRGTNAGGKKDDDLEAATRMNDGPKGDKGDEKFEIGGDLNLSSDHEDFLNGGGGGDDKANDQDNGIIVEVDNVLELFVGTRHKLKEESERQAKIEDSKGVIKQLQRKMKSCPPDDAGLSD